MASTERTYFAPRRCSERDAIIFQPLEEPVNFVIRQWFEWKRHEHVRPVIGVMTGQSRDILQAALGDEYYRRLELWV